MALAEQWFEQFPDALSARIASARLALQLGVVEAMRSALRRLLAETTARGTGWGDRWRCCRCGVRADAFSWRCAQCRRWGTLRIDLGNDTPPPPARERRRAPRSARAEDLLGPTADASLPVPLLADRSAGEDDRGSGESSLLGKVGGWFSNVWRRDASR